MSEATTKASRAWLVALPLVTVAAAAALWNVGQGKDQKGQPAPTGSTTAPATASAAEAVALQPPDLPPGMQRCSFAGEINAYIDHFRKVDAQSADGIRDTWKQLQAQGATGGYYSSFANSAGTCDTMQGGGMSDGPGGEHQLINGRPPTTAFTFVVAYKDPTAAESAYKADIFAQSQLKDKAFDVAEGDPSGLGPNSTLATSRAPAALLRQAIWQRRGFTVYFGSESLQPDESRAALRAVDGRIG